MILFSIKWHRKRDAFLVFAPVGTVPPPIASRIPPLPSSAFASPSGRRSIASCESNTYRFQRRLSRACLGASQNKVVVTPLLCRARPSSAALPGCAQRSLGPSDDNTNETKRLVDQISFCLSDPSLSWQMIAFHHQKAAATKGVSVSGVSNSSHRVLAWSVQAPAPRDRSLS
jgi:hypothetical protein